MRDAAEDYQSTVHAMLAFSAFVVHDASAQRPGSHFGFGRRMTTSKANVVTSSGTVTPDIVAQKSESYGVVAEVKRSLPSDRTKWAAHVGQIRKYDDDLTGWWTSDARMATSDTTLLLHQTRSRAFISVLDDEGKKNAEAVGPHTSVVEFNRSDERQVSYFFRLEWGDVRDADLSGRLKEGVAVPIDKVIRTFANVKFYDADPPLPSLLALLWIDYFAPLAAAVAYDENLKAFPIDVGATAIADELQRAYGSRLLERDERSVEFPGTKVVRNALNALVTIKLAMPLPTGTAQYRVLYRQFNDDILLRFASMLKTSAEKVTEQQATLPFNEPQAAITAPAVTTSPKRKSRVTGQMTNAAVPAKKSKKKPQPK
ncbi:MAG TPA: hypothetical protein VHX14_23085 [Thermoanaerobaculia bacterium]|nr:hypothetical protein [Thermoanaerobaculia bacterium]